MITGGGENNLIHSSGMPPLPPAWHLPVSLGLWAVSIFLLLQSVAYLRWATKGEVDAPNPRAGVILGWSLTAAILSIFYFNSKTFEWLSYEPITDRFPGHFALGLVTFPFKESEALSQALLFSSLPTGALAVVKFVMAAAFERSDQGASSPLGRSPLVLVSASLFTLLQLAGSIASLLAFFH